MLIRDYPPQEPKSEVLVFLHARLMELADGIDGREHRYGDDPSQSLMVYPASDPGSPVLIFMHGGGWTNGYKEEMAFLAPVLNAAGITLVSNSYRLAPKHVFPANFDDAADAVAATWRLAEHYGYNRDAIFIGGHSAGGHLSSLLSVTFDWQQARGLPPEVIKGCLPISGTFDFTPGCGLSMRPRFLGPQNIFNEVKASPIFRVADRSPPFFITYGAKDFPHLMVQSEKFAMVLRSKGIAAETLEIPEATHGTVLLMAAERDKPWLDSSVRWMATITSSRKPTS